MKNVNKACRKCFWNFDFEGQRRKGERGRETEREGERRSVIKWENGIQRGIFFNIFNSLKV